MNTIRLLTCAGAAACIALLPASFAAADAVDDLLAGKPVVISPADAASPAASAKDHRTLERLIESRNGQADPPDESSLSSDPLEVTLADPSASLDISQASDDVHLTTDSTTNMTLVPEPSAVLLAVSSLVYFLIFFRRRYSF